MTETNLNMNKFCLLFFQYLQLQPKVELVRGYEIPTERLNGEIRFENVSFAYPTRPDHVNIYRHLNTKLNS